LNNLNSNNNNNENDIISGANLARSLSNLTSELVKDSHYNDDDDDDDDNFTPTYFQLLFTTKSGLGWVNGSAMPTGWALIIVLLIIVIFSMPCIRRNGYFQLFYITHWFHVFFYIILILHARNFWKWFVFPLCLIMLERILNCIRIRLGSYGETKIKHANLLASRVTHLVIQRPPNFKFKPGDFIFIRIPAIAKFEWHPFTISSAPDLKDELWLHIRSLGHWTNKVYEYFSNYSKLEQNYSNPVFKSELEEVNSSNSNSNSSSSSNNTNENSSNQMKRSNQGQQESNFDLSNVVMVNYLKKDEMDKEYQIKLNAINKIENIYLNVIVINTKLIINLFNLIQ
jgi:hypothetical protein